MKCSACGAESEPLNERHWREVTITVGAIPPRVAGTVRITDLLCPLCAAEADQRISGRDRDADIEQ